MAAGRLRDLVAGAGRTMPPATSPVLMIGEVIEVDPLLITVAALDNRLRAHRPFCTLPDASPGDEVRVMHDENDGLVVVAWEAA